MAGLIESVLGGAAVNQTLAGLAGSLASLYGAALAQPALALGAIPTLIPGAVTSLWSLLGNALREAAKPPPIVRFRGLCQVLKCVETVRSALLVAELPCLFWPRMVGKPLLFKWIDFCLHCS